MIILCFNNNNIETYIPPPKIQDLNFETLRTVSPESPESPEKESPESNESKGCDYNIKNRIIKDGNVLQQESYVNIYDSNFGGFLGTTLGTTK